MGDQGGGGLEPSAGAVMGREGFWDPWGQGRRGESREEGAPERECRRVGADSGHRDSLLLRFRPSDQ